MTLNVLFLAAEADPFVKIGGLGDVAGALPTAISNFSQNEAHIYEIDIRLVLPFYPVIKQKIKNPKFLGKLPVHKTTDEELCDVYLDESQIYPVYLLDGDPIRKSAEVYNSNPILDSEKFTFFSLAALSLPDFLNWKVDILHCNDWHTAIAIYALQSIRKTSQFLRNTKTVHTLHNLPYMGTGSEPALLSYGIKPAKSSTLPYWARHTPLPLGLLYADKIVAVSPNYAQEIITPDFGCGLEDFLKSRKAKITGIINGLDYEKWDPTSDPVIKANYSIDSLIQRKTNKTYLQKKFKIDVDDRIPLLSIVSRMDPQKGIDIALEGLRRTQEKHWQAIILGTGNSDVEKLACTLENELPKRVRSIIDYDSKLANQLYAGADIFLMPSRYEPCGLSQLIAMRYGCVPIARATGGLVNTIKHVSHKIDGGTGFLFDKPYPSTFARTLTRSLRLFKDNQFWQKIQINGMTSNFSWENSAAKYIELYRVLVNNQQR